MDRQANRNAENSGEPLPQFTPAPKPPAKTYPPAPERENRKAEPESAFQQSPPKPQGVPGQQQGLFGGDDLKTGQKLPTFVSPEHFSAMFHACEVATMPDDLPNVSSTDWWRGLLLLLYMTGWRIGQTLKLKHEDIDFEAGTALSRADSNKGRRDQLIPLHPLVIQYLKPLTASFNPLAFPWNHNNRTLWSEFARITNAGVCARQPSVGARAVILRRGSF